MIETKSTWPYIDIFSHYKGNISTFVETGTCSGDSVQDAIKLGFTKILSVDISTDCIANCAAKFEEEIESGLVRLFVGDSRQVFPIMLQLVNERAMFWLDAHQDANNTVREEISCLYNHHIKNHIIIIDDIPLYFNEESLKELQHNISLINEKYIFEFNSMHGKEKYQLIAYINE